MGYSLLKGRRNRIIGPSQLVASANIFTPTVDQKYTLGLELDLNDATGRKFRYCKNGAVALGKALMNVNALLDAEAITSTAQTNYGASKDDTKFTVLLTTLNAWTNDALVDGWLHVGDGATAMGDMYMIKANKWVDGVGTDDTLMRVEITEPLRNAIVAGDDIVLFQSKYANIVVAPITQTEAGADIGISLADVPISYYFWAQYRGYAPIIMDTQDTPNTMPNVGEPVGRPNTHDVAGTCSYPHTDMTDAVWGTMIYGSKDAEVGIIDLMLP